MKADIFRAHHAHGHESGQSTSRREALKLGAGAVAAAAAVTAVGVTPAGAENNTPPDGRRGGRGGGQGKNRNGNKHGGNGSDRYGPASGSYSNDMFDVNAVLAGAWDNPVYGFGDQRGTLNELSAERNAAALNVLNRGRAVKTYQLGEEMFNGFPAFPSDPPRLHDMFLYTIGIDTPAGFAEGGGIISSPDAIGGNLVSVFEERFAANFTFQIATQIDGLNHIGVGDVFYGGYRGSQIATPTGTSALGNETMGPIMARAVIYDVVGLKVAQGMTDDFFVAANGQPVLRDNYRITLDDMQACLRRQGVSPVGVGDVPIMHTGWTHLVRSDAGRYLTQEPGIYLEEARYFADRRVALVATDTWGLEVLDPEVTGGNAFPVHQVLITKEGIRIGESFVTDSAIADNCFEGVLVVTPENVPGATCGSTPPVLLGQPGRAPRD